MKLGEIQPRAIFHNKARINQVAKGTSKYATKESEINYSEHSDRFLHEKSLDQAQRSNI